MFDVYILPLSILGGILVLILLLIGAAYWRHKQNLSRRFTAALKALEIDSGWGDWDGMSFRFEAIPAEGGLVYALRIPFEIKERAPFRATSWDFHVSFIDAKDLAKDVQEDDTGRETETGFFWVTAAAKEKNEGGAAPQDLSEDQRRAVLRLIRARPQTVVGELGILHWMHAVPQQMQNLVKVLEELISCARVLIGEGEGEGEGKTHEAASRGETLPMVVSKVCPQEPEPMAAKDLFGMTRKMGLECRSPTLGRQRLAIYQAMQFLERNGFSQLQGAVPLQYFLETDYYLRIPFKKVFVRLESDWENAEGDLEVSFGLFSLGHDILIKRLKKKPWNELMDGLARATRIVSSATANGSQKPEIKRG